MGGLAESPGTVPGRSLLRYRFRPALPGRDPAAERKFASALLTALRVAAGLETTFAVEFRSGRNGTLSIELPPGPATIWARTVLFPSYRPASWAALEGAGLTRKESPVLFGVVEGTRGLPLPIPETSGPFSDALLGSLPSISEGVTLRFDLTATAASPVRTPAQRPREPLVATPLERIAPPTDLERRLRERSEARRHEPQWIVQVSIRVRESRLRPQGARMAQVARISVRFEGGNGLRFVPRRRWFRTRPPPLEFSEHELAGLFPSPFGTFSNPGTERTPDPRLLLGRSEGGGYAGIPVPSSEGRHLLLLGETGSGKSSALLRLALSALRRHAVVLLDPIGDTARRFRALLPPESQEIATFVSPIENPIGINALASASDRSAALASERGVPDLVEALRRVRLARFADTPFWGPRIEEALQRTLTAAAASPRATLAEAYRLLAPEEGEFHGWGEAGREAARALHLWAQSRTEEVEGTRRLLGEVARNPVLRTMLCESAHPWDLANAGAPGAITIISGDAPQAGETAARYLLGVYLALLWPILLGRERSSKLFLFLDEVQMYGHAAVAEFLRLGRRANLHLYAATQSLSSLPRDLAEPFRTNAADLLLFRGDPDDAREFSRWNPALSMERLLAQPRGSGALLVGKGEELRWVQIRPPRRAVRSPTTDHPSQIAFARSEPSPSRGTSLSAQELTALRSAAIVTPEGWLRVSLSQLRGNVPRGDLAVRQLGGVLRAEGFLRRSGRDADGRFWELSGLPPEPFRRDPNRD